MKHTCNCAVYTVYKVIGPILFTLSIPLVKLFFSSQLQDKSRLPMS